MSDHNPTMFCHDSTTIFYPTAPGRVYMIAIAALADCDGSDDDLSDSTEVGDVWDMTKKATNGTWLWPIGDENAAAPTTWPKVYDEVGGDIVGPFNWKATAQDFHDALEQWADWCDRDSARLDSLDGVLAAVAAA